MSCSTSWLYFVYSLTSWTTWSCKLIFYVFWVHFKCKRNYRHYYHWYCAWMQPSFDLCFRYSDDFMNSCLTFHHFMTTLALNFHVKLFIAFTNSSLLDNTRNTTSPTHTRGKRLIHLTNILNKDATLWPSSSRSKLKYNIINFLIGSFRCQ